MNHIATAMDLLIDLQLERHAWISRAAEQIRRWKEEDEAAGMPWDAHPQSEPLSQRSVDNGD